MHTAAAELIPRRAVQTALALLLLTLIGIAATRFGGEPIAASDARTIAQRDLRFDDLADGGIDIRDAASGQRVDTAHGEQGFLRGTLRSMARERKRREVSPGEPMTLTLLGRADGRLTLLDRATGNRIDLEAFGRDNAALFAQWLNKGSS